MVALILATVVSAFLELAEICENRKLRVKLVATAKEWLVEAGDPVPEAGLLSCTKVPSA